MLTTRMNFGDVVNTSAEVMNPYDGKDDVIVLVLDTGEMEEKALSRLYCLSVAIISLEFS